MFYNCPSLNELDFSSFNTSDVTNMNYMFYSCTGLSYLNFTSFNTLKCNNFDKMFGECNAINITINKQNNPKLVSSAPTNIEFNFTD